MKILHTADWHLGQTFHLQTNTREEEHRMTLNWLADLIEQEKIDVLIIAGDIFDVINPPNYARQLYYDFLKKLLKTDCQAIFIVGGNHDSAPMLNAPKELLASFQIYIVGCTTENLDDELFTISNKDNEPIGIFVAVPFLRDRDLRTSIAGESGIERIDRIKNGIAEHYRALAEKIEKMNLPIASVPIIATGHLYAKGATSAAKQANIYIGNMENIEASEFPAIFDYVALGHLHRAQPVGGVRHIRYSGSLIALDFSEKIDKKSVTILEFEGKKLGEIRQIAVPIFRDLLTFTGTFDEVVAKLQVEAMRLTQKKHANPAQFLDAWVEIVMNAENELRLDLDTELRALAKNMPLEILKIKTNRPYYSLDSLTALEDLKNIDEIEVFKKRCESLGKISAEENNLLMEAFLELRAFLNS